MRDHFLAIRQADLGGTVAIDEQDLAGRDDRFAGHGAKFGQERQRSKKGEEKLITDSGK